MTNKQERVANLTQALRPSLYLEYNGGHLSTTVLGKSDMTFFPYWNSYDSTSYRNYCSAVCRTSDEWLENWLNNNLEKIKPIDTRTRFSNAVGVKAYIAFLSKHTSRLPRPKVHDYYPLENIPLIGEAQIDYLSTAKADLDRLIGPEAYHPILLVDPSKIVDQEKHTLCYSDTGESFLAKYKSIEQAIADEDYFIVKINALHENSAVLATTKKPQKLTKHLLELLWNRLHLNDEDDRFILRLGLGYKPKHPGYESLALVKAIQDPGKPLTDKDIEQAKEVSAKQRVTIPLGAFQSRTVPDDTECARIKTSLELAKKAKLPQATALQAKYDELRATLQRNANLSIVKSLGRLGFIVEKIEFNGSSDWSNNYSNMDRGAQIANSEALLKQYLEDRYKYMTCLQLRTKYPVKMYLDSAKKDVEKAQWVIGGPYRLRLFNSGEGYVSLASPRSKFGVGVLYDAEPVIRLHPHTSAFYIEDGIELKELMNKKASICLGDARSLLIKAMSEKDILTSVLVCYSWLQSISAKDDDWGRSWPMFGTPRTNSDLKIRKPRNEQAEEANR